MSTGFAFKQSLHLYSVSNLRIFLVFQLRTFKVGFSGPECFRGFRETGPWAELLENWLALTSVKYHDNLLTLMLLNQWLALTMLRTTVKTVTVC